MKFLFPGCPSICKNESHKTLCSFNENSTPDMKLANLMTANVRHTAKFDESSALEL